MKKMILVMLPFLVVMSDAVECNVDGARTEFLQCLKTKQMENMRLTQALIKSNNQLVDLSNEFKKKNESLKEEIKELQRNTKKVYVNSGNRGAGIVHTNSTVPTRTLQFYKKYKETSIRIAYNDNVKFPAGYFTFEFLIDGKSCPNRLTYKNYTSSNRHLSSTNIGYCKKLAVGSHTLTVKVIQNKGFFQLNSTWTLEAEEIFVQE